MNDLLKPQPRSTKGHFSAKLVTRNPDGSETWTDFDTRKDKNPIHASMHILVFDSSSGKYEKAKNLDHAKNLFDKHRDRILNPKVTVSESVPKRHPKRVASDSNLLQVRTEVTEL